MQTFVTGGTGLLGNNLVRTLLAAGHSVRALVRSPAKAERELGDTTATIVVGDIRDVASYADALRGVDVVFHTAAYFREYYAPGDHAALVERINVTATLELARAARARGVGRLIDTGTAGLVGTEPDGRPGRETTAPWPGSRRNLYLQSKRKVEWMLREFSRDTGLFVATALPAWMWGPFDAAPTASGQLIRDALQRKLPPAVPPGGSSVVDARDVAAGMLRIAEVGRPGRRYILSGGYIDLGDLVVRLARLTGSPPPRTRLPYAGAFALAAAAEAWSRVSRRPSPMSRESIRLLNARLAVDAGRARAELGVEFRAFDETLADSVAWASRRMAGGGGEVVAPPAAIATQRDVDGAAAAGNL